MRGGINSNLGLIIPTAASAVVMAAAVGVILGASLITVLAAGIVLTARIFTIRGGGGGGGGGILLQIRTALVSFVDGGGNWPR